jgi:hypothetical protein
MRVRDWQDILEDVVESNADPQGWRAVSGSRRRGVGEDMYLGHPSAGVFQLKTYAKNPFEVKGVGADVARRIDDDIDPLFPEQGSGRFGVQPAITDEDQAKDTARRVTEVLRTHADTEGASSGDALFDDVMEAMDSPAFGPMDHDQYGRPEGMNGLSDTFEEAEELLEAEFDDLVSDDGVDRGFQ